MNPQDPVLLDQIKNLKPGARVRVIFETTYVAEAEFLHMNGADEFMGKIKAVFDEKGEPVPEDVFKKHNNTMRLLKRSYIQGVVS